MTRRKIDIFSKIIYIANNVLYKRINFLKPNLINDNGEGTFLILFYYYILYIKQEDKIPKVSKSVQVARHRLTPKNFCQRKQLLAKWLIPNKSHKANIIMVSYHHQPLTS